MPSGQERRAWLDRQDERLQNALAYYLGPAAAPINALAQVGAWLSPGEDMMDMYRSGTDLMGSNSLTEAVQNAGWLGVGALGMALPGSAGAVRRAVDDAPQGIRAYHGSPHDFDRFSMDRIGTGEGAQAYGHGLYFAEKEGVAKSYRDALSRDRLATPDGGSFDVSTIGGWEDFEANYLSPLAEAAPPLVRNEDSFTSKDYEGLISEAYERAEPGKDFAEEMRNAATWLREKSETEVDRLRGYPMKPGTLNVIRDQYLQAADFADSLASGGAQSVPGRMYEVNINANPDDFLDWDKPLSEQPSGRKLLDDFETRRQAALAKVPEQDGSIPFDEFDRMHGPALEEAARYRLKPEWTGAQLYESSRLVPGDFRDKQAATAALRDAGIPGIRYLDQGSRGAGDGTRNYVVFDDSLIEILRKYGWAGLAALGGMNALSGEPVEQY